MAECVKCHSHNIIESENGFYCCNCGWDSKKEEYVKRINKGDRIRSMTDEELAELFVYWDCDGADYTTNLPINGCKWGSKEEMLSRVLEYLQSEVEE